MIFSPLHPEDVEEVAALEQACFTLPWSKALFLEELKHPELSTWRLARETEDGPILAYMGYWKAVDEAHIVNLAVRPESRGKGTGYILAGHLLELAKRAGCLRATLEVRTSNQAALRLYARLGFAVIALREKYYSDNQEDALIMWKETL